MPGTRTSGGISCPAIGPNFAGALRFSPLEGTGKSPKPKMRRQRCAFCGRPKTTFLCAGCKQRYCVRPPTHIENPETPGRKFRVNGPNCWQLDHGVKLVTFRETYLLNHISYENDNSFTVIANYTIKLYRSS